MEDYRQSASEPQEQAKARSQSHSHYSRTLPAETGAYTLGWAGSPYPRSHLETLNIRQLDLIETQSKKSAHEHRESAKEKNEQEPVVYAVWNKFMVAVCQDSGE
ncbi:hypothetical protein PISMIDRAFT_675730 [Pisolithus microcarpus 441]|uniref:Uncharacterized protein n=1 Tax=Pisolithus microcarpus 441 TaxID=765257 RepID=A0A0C9ZLI9_9AGAM|nr:hypothetical protein PISMIDRAFT_675730 [Pisolithus microcarpus 441]